MKLEVVVVPVSGADQAKDFYKGWAGGWTPTSSQTLGVRRRTVPGRRTTCQSCCQ